MRNTYLVFRRDYLGYVSAWGFWLGLAVVPIIMIAFGIIGALAASSTPTRYYAVVETGNVYGPEIEKQFERNLENLEEGLAELGLDGQLGEQFGEQVAAQLPGFIRVPAPGTTVDDLRPWLLGEQLVSGPDGDKPLFAAVIVPRDGSEIQYWSEDVTVGDLRSAVRNASRNIARNRVFAAANIDPEIIDRADDSALPVLEQRIRTAEEQVEAGNEVTLADRAPFFVSVAMAYMLWLMIFSVVQYLLMSTIEERSNKIFDTLLTSVRLPQLLAGKLGAVFAVTATMMGVWVLIGAGVTLFSSAALPGELREAIGAGVAASLQPSILIPALISFVLGYLLYGVIFIALGSLCDTIQEAQTLISPLFIILMIPMFMILIAFDDPTSPIVQFVSWIPFFTPFLLILRMPTEPPLWEVMAQIGLMAGTTLLVLWLATKVYRAGAVHGAGVSDAMDWMKRIIPGMGKKDTAEPVG